MPSRQKKCIPRGTQAGVPVGPELQEQIVQTFALISNKAETARRCGVTEKTVSKYINKVQPAAILEERAKALRELSGTAHIKAKDILDSIKPDDLDSGRFEIKNAKGEIVGYKYYGPSLMQKVTSAAIAIDKVKVLSETESILKDGRASGELIVPGDIRALIHGIRGKIKGLSILDVRFAEENPDLSQRIQDKLAEAEAVANATPATGEVSDFDFDNPGGLNDAN